MKIRSLLLGSLALASVSTGGYAADLGVVTSLDICDELGLSGLTISSDSNCLVISGGVEFSYNFGDYDYPATYTGFNQSPGPNHTIIYPDTSLVGDDYDSDVDIDTWLKLVATSQTDFGDATATIKLVSETGQGSSDWSVGIDEAWVGIGDSTVLMAGYKSSIFNSGDDVALNYLNMFYALLAGPPPSPGGGFPDSGVGRAPVTNPVAGTVRLGGAVIQATSDLGNGISVAGGLEGLGNDPGNNTAADDGDLTIVGVVSYDSAAADLAGGPSSAGPVGVAPPGAPPGGAPPGGDRITAHLSGAANPMEQDWYIHAGFTGTWDPITIVGAVASDSTGYYNALASAAVTIDMFKLAGSVEFVHSEVNSIGIPITPGDEDEFGAGGSITATLMDGITINLGGRYFTNLGTGDYAAQAEAAIAAVVAEGLTLNGAVGIIDSTYSAGVGIPDDDFDPLTAGPDIPLGTTTYARVGVAWAPGGFSSGFRAGAAITVTSDGAYQLNTTAAKTFQ